jgi:hypothetical protein
VQARATFEERAVPFDAAAHNPKRDGDAIAQVGVQAFGAIGKLRK